MGARLGEAEGCEGQMELARRRVAGTRPLSIRPPPRCSGGGCGGWGHDGVSGLEGGGRGVGSGAAVGLGGREEGDRTSVEDAAVHDVVERACPGAAGDDGERPWPRRSRATVWTPQEESDERTQPKEHMRAKMNHMGGRRARTKEHMCPSGEDG